MEDTFTRIMASSLILAIGVLIAITVNYAFKKKAEAKCHQKNYGHWYQSGQYCVFCGRKKDKVKK
jgi:hypothetical protein